MDSYNFISSVPEIEAKMKEKEAYSKNDVITDYKTWPKKAILFHVYLYIIIFQS